MPPEYTLHPHMVSWGGRTPNQFTDFFGFPTASHPRTVPPPEADFRRGLAENDEEGHQSNGSRLLEETPLPQGAGLHPSDSTGNDAILSHIHFPSQNSSPYHA